MASFVAIFAALMIAAAAVAQPVPGPEHLIKMLVPITVRSAPGAYASHWNSQLLVKFDHDTVPGFITPLFGDALCAPECPTPGGPGPGMSSIGFYPTLPGESPGSYLYIDRSVADRIRFALIVREPSANVAVPLRVISEMDAFTSTMHVLGVPSDPRKRLRLRVYSFDHGTSVRVRAFAHPGNELYFEEFIELTASNLQHPHKTGTGVVLFPVRPPAAELAIPQALPPSVTLRVEIESLTAGVRLWAFITVTDNATQHVSVYNPS